MQSKNYLEILKIVQHAIFNLNENNFKETAQATVTTLFDNHFPYSFKLIISQLLCASIVSQVKNFKIYMNFLRNIEENVDKMTEFFVKFLQLNFGLQESNYFLEFIMKHNYMDPKIIEYNNNPLYFAHRHTKKGQIFYIDTIEDDFSKNYEELSKNDWELHKKLIEEGVNPNEIAKIIRDDEVEKLQEISSHANFDFNQAIRPSLYERYSITYNSWTSLADYAAFFGSIKCFKFLIMNKANITNALKYAIAGGNIEIIHLCEQDNPSFKVACETSIQYHRNNIFHYFYEKKNIEVEDIMELGKCCVLYNNYDIFSFLLENGMKINDVIFNESVKNGNIFLMKYFLKENQMPKNILIFASESNNVEFIKYIIDNKGIDINPKNNIRGWTALMRASEKGHTEIVKLLLEQEGIDINAKDNDEATALMWASRNGHTEIVKLLLEQKGFDINVSM